MTILAGGGVFTVISAIIAAIVGWRRSGAETTQIIEATASEQIKTLVGENQRLWAKLGELEQTLEKLSKDLRSRDRQVEDLSEDLEDSFEYIRLLRDELLRQDPSLRLPEPPPRIAKHFPP